MTLLRRRLPIDPQGHSVLWMRGHSYINRTPARGPAASAQIHSGEWNVSVSITFDGLIYELSGLSQLSS
jgi:hypothetical protein